jgi:predicted phage terminase large subunit-like protein
VTSYVGDLIPETAYEIELRASLRSNLTGWASYAVARVGQRPAAHHRLLLEHLERISRGEIDRLIVLMPPGSAKSTYASILFPAWWFTQHPRSSVIGASHTAALAAHFSRRIRDTITQHKSRLGYEISSSNRAASHWTTTAGGEYYSAGTHGTFVGRRADLIIIDDPLKSQAEADSPSLRDRIWTWYQSDLATRLKPRARIVLIMTRWHEDDLGGRLLARSDTDWVVLRLPALAEADDILGRAPGEPLWPAWESPAELARKRLSVGERTWSALFQQSPRPQTGGLFDVSHLQTTDAASEEGHTLVVRAWDLAATAATGDNDPDWTVGLKLSCNLNGTFTVLDVVRMRGTPRQVEEIIVATAAADGPAVRIGLPEDPGQAGRSQITYLVSRLRGYQVSASRETGGKTVRATPVASQMDAGNIAIVAARWNHALIDELREFPFSRKDDQVDALSRAFGMLINAVRPSRKVNIPFLTR